MLFYIYFMFIYYFKLILYFVSFYLVFVFLLLMFDFNNVSHQEVFGAREEMDQTAILLKKIEGVRVEKQKLNAKSENSKV